MTFTGYLRLYLFLFGACADFVDSQIGSGEFIFGLKPDAKQDFEYAIDQKSAGKRNHNGKTCTQQLGRQ
jgi:hypothetical protein